MRYLQNLRAGTIDELVVIGSGTGAAGALGCLSNGFERVAGLLVSPRRSSIAGDRHTAQELGAGKLLIVVARDDLLGIEASAHLIGDRGDRECWIADGRGRGAELFASRMDLFFACVEKITNGLDDRDSR
jgi:hypothetical protein